MKASCDTFAQVKRYHLWLRGASDLPPKLDTSSLLLVFYYDKTYPILSS